MKPRVIDQHGDAVKCGDQGPTTKRLQPPSCVPVRSAGRKAANPTLTTGDVCQGCRNIAGAAAHDYVTQDTKHSTSAASCTQPLHRAQHAKKTAATSAGQCPRVVGQRHAVEARIGVLVDTAREGGRRYQWV